VQATQSLAPFAEQNDMAMTMDERFDEGRLICWPMHEIGLHMRKYFRDPYNYAPGAGAETLYEAQTRGLNGLADIAGRCHELPVVAMHGILLSAILKHFKPDFGFSNWQALNTPELYKITFDGPKPIELEELAA
jgi:2,3-bisphosphoglycerate-dependent phosphoglycerate mutase